MRFNSLICSFSTSGCPFSARLLHFGPLFAPFSWSSVTTLCSDCGFRHVFCLGLIVGDSFHRSACFCVFEVGLAAGSGPAFSFLLSLGMQSIYVTRANLTI